MLFRSHAKAPQPDVLDAIESLRAVTLSDMAGLRSEVGELREHDDKAAIAGGAAANFTAMPQVGGDPIVESGSNADGEWTRWSDGSQVLRVIVSSGWTSNSTAFNDYESFGVSINLPRPFIDLDFTFGGGIKLGASAVRRMYEGCTQVTTTSVHVNQMIYGSVSRIPVCVVFFGRWK